MALLPSSFPSTTSTPPCRGRPVVPRSALLFAFALCALALLAPTAQARDVPLDLEAFDDGGRFGFRRAGSNELNPDLGLQPGDVVTLSLRNTGTAPHNLVVEGVSGGTVPCCLQPGESAQARFTVPADAEGPLAYWCEPHRGTLGMEGEAVAGRPDSGRGAPGPPLAVLASGLVVAALLRRR